MNRLESKSVSLDPIGPPGNRPPLLQSLTVLWTDVGRVPQVPVVSLEAGGAFPARRTHAAGPSWPPASLGPSFAVQPSLGNSDRYGSFSVYLFDLTRVVFTIVVCLSLIWCLSSIVLLGDLGHLCYCLNDYTYSTAKFYLFNFNQICLGYILYACWPSALKFLIYRVHATLDPSPSTWHAKSH